MITGRLRQQQPPPPPPPPQQPQFQMPRTPQEAQALFESLLAAGQIPQEIVERMQKGERFALRVTPQGLVLQSAGPAQPAPAAGDAPAAPAATDGSAPAAQAPAAPPPAPPAPPAAPAPAPAAMRPAAPPPAPRPGSQPKPGRNDDCPCGSGIKYKKCCAPAFD
jgi:hypothetical protein